MKIHVLSDLHLDFGTFTVPQVACDVVVLAGDVREPGQKGVVWAARPSTFAPEIPVIYVAGNHDYYGGRLGSTLDDMRQLAAGTAVRILDTDETLVEARGERVRFLGCTLWTDFRLRIAVPRSMNSPLPGAMRLVSNPDKAIDSVGHGLNDYRRVRHVPGDGIPEEPITPADTLRIHHEHRDWLKRKLAEPFSGQTVVVTHHAPHRGSLAPRFADSWLSPGFVSELPDEFFEIPVLWIHGHNHDSFDYRVRNCRVVCNPRGYVRRDGSVENHAFQPGLVIDTAVPGKEASQPAGEPGHQPTAQGVPAELRRYT